MCTDVFAISGHLPCDFDLKRLKCIGCHGIKLCTRFERNRTIRGLSYGDLKIESFGALRHVGFDRKK